MPVNFFAIHAFNAPVLPLAIALDASGRAYVTGGTRGNTPITSNAYQASPGGAFLSVLDPSASGASSLVYSTYFGPGQGEFARGIAMDAFGMAYITGGAGTNFPVTPGAFQTTLGGGDDVFVAKFNPNASGAAALIYSTYLGGPENDIGLDIAVDQLGNAYVGGETNHDPGFPVTPRALQPTCPCSDTNAFVAALNASGNALIYSTYVELPGYGNGTVRNGSVNGIAVDAAGNAYVTGGTSNVPTTPDAFQPHFGGCSSQPLDRVFACDAFVAKLNPTGDTLLYSSYLGGSGSDEGFAIAIDATGDAYVVGGTSSADFPVTQGAFQPQLNPGGGGPGLLPVDAFVTKFPLGSPAGFAVTGILPNTGGNAGQVTTTIVGAEFQDGVSVSLAGSTQPAIPGSPANVAPERRTITATFDLHDAVPGARDLIVTNPDDTTITLSNAFTITEGGSPNVWVQIVGRSGIRLGADSNLDVIVGNLGNVDAVGVPVWVAGIPSSWRVTPDFPVMPPPAIDGAPLVDWSTVPVVIDTETALGQIIPLFIPVIPADTTVDLHFTIHPSSSSLGAQLQAWVNPPYFHSPLDQDVLGCLDALAKVVFTKLVGFAPLPACGQAVAGIIARLLTTIVKLGPGTLTPNTGMIPIYSQVAFHVLGLKFLINCGGLVVPEVLIVQKSIALFSDIANGSSIVANCLGVLAQGAKSLFQLIVVASHDPNEKVGATGVGQQKYISGRGAVPYSILFENIPTATAPAQEVIVSDSLDPDLDLSTLSLGPITIGGGRQIPIPATFSPAAGLNEVATTVDLRPAQNLFVKLDAKLDPATRLLTVTFASIDPSTGQPPTDPTVGFLPPGAEGSVFFSVKPEQGLTTGTQITNQASVVFDKLAPISTLPWTNTIDATPPTSHILPLPAVENSPSFTVQWAGTDVGSGILDYTIFVSENNGPFTPFISNTTTTSATFTGQSGKSYAFYSIARDQAGNLEDAKTRPEATTQVAADTTPPVITVSATPTTLWPPNGKMAPVTVSGTITDAGSGVNASTATYAVTDEYRSVQPSGKVTLGSNGSYTFTIQLQASRNGNDKDGRQYIITVSAQDNAGNKGVAATGVTVPHDQGH